MLLRGLIFIQFVFVVSAATASAQGASQLGVTNPLIGRTGSAAKPSIDALSANPAQAGDISRSAVQVIWGLTSTTYSQRYPGFKAHSSKTQSLEPRLPIPQFIWKPSRNFGIGGLLIPFPVSQDIAITELPLVILGQQNSVDITGSGTLKGMAKLVAGYRFTDEFSLGAQFEYLAIDADGDITPTGGTDSLASFSISSTKIGVGLGIKVKLRKLTLGLSSTVFSSEQSTTNFSSILADEEEKDDSGAGEEQVNSEFLNPIRLGLGFDMTDSLFFSSDVRYTRADKGQTRFSVVDFEEKQLDTYDTVAFFLGSELRLNAKSDLLFGYFNEPASIGAGSPGENGKTGFGFMDLAMNLGQPPEEPVWGAGVGGRYRFSRVGRAKRTRFQMMIEGGMVYSETSIGIGEDGEQPGAYLVQRYQFPVKFVYKF